MNNKEIDEFLSALTPKVRGSFGAKDAALISCLYSVSVMLAEIVKRLPEAKEEGK